MGDVIGASMEMEFLRQHQHGCTGEGERQGSAARGELANAQNPTVPDMVVFVELGRFPDWPANSHVVREAMQLLLGEGDVACAHRGCTICRCRSL